MIYSAGRNCPICFDSSGIIFLKKVHSNQIFFACYACGCAWETLPKEDEEFDILASEDFAPDGFLLATLPDIELANGTHLISQQDSEIISQEYSENELLTIFLKY